MLIISLVVFISIHVIISGADLMIFGVDSLGKRYPSLQNFLAHILAVLSSSPELAISVAAAMAGNPEIVLANVIASNVINTVFLFIASIKKSKFKYFFKRDFLDEWFGLLVTAALPLLIYFDLIAPRLHGRIGIGVFVLFFLWEMFFNKKEFYHGDTKRNIGMADTESVWVIFKSLFIGCGMIVAGGIVFSEYSDQLVNLLKSSLPIIATVVGICAGFFSSAPEYKSYLYIMSNEDDSDWTIAQKGLDNALTSNVFNFGLIYPLSLYLAGIF